MTSSIALTPVGTVLSSRSDIKDENWDAETSRIELDSLQFSPDALAGLTEFSHLMVLFFMDKVPAEQVEKGSRHPRNNPAWPKIGIFAQRYKGRPNRMGITVCRLVKIDGLSVHVQGLDALDGTPVIDIKPWFDAFGPRGKVVEPKWVSEVMAGFW